ncbi:unnamed protein product [Ambrosiozyma monospora]|uniref:Unnamed protein product n=1 Tax=Ambrosiozyma monospora TaxID=43982 RepID=A0A9W6YTK8_AMBMO|nr:unnamed protein product [Ambrosiozyma monospora]
MDEEFLHHHLNELIDSVKSHQAVKDILNNEQASNAVDFLQKNGKPIIYSLSAVAVVYVLRKLFFSSSSSSSSSNVKKIKAAKKIKRNRMSASPPPVYSHLERVKTTNLHARNTPEPPAVPLDPVTAGNNLIDQINTEFKEDYEVPLNKFFNTVDLRYAELKGEQEEVGADGEQKATTSICSSMSICWVC